MKWLRGIEDLSLGLILINFILFIVMGGIIFICKGSWVYLGFFILVLLVVIKIVLVGRFREVWLDIVGY